MPFEGLEHQFIYLIYMRVKDNNDIWHSCFRIAHDFNISRWIDIYNNRYQCENQIGIVGVIGSHTPFLLNDLLKSEYQHYQIHIPIDVSAPLYQVSEDLYTTFFDDKRPLNKCSRPVMTFDEVCNFDHLCQQLAETSQ